MLLVLQEHVQLSVAHLSFTFSLAALHEAVDSMSFTYNTTFIMTVIPGQGAMYNRTEEGPNTMTGTVTESSTQWNLWTSTVGDTRGQGKVKEN